MLRKLAIKVGVLLEAHPEAIRATKLSAILAELRDSGECERHSGHASSPPDARQRRGHAVFWPWELARPFLPRTRHGGNEGSHVSSSVQLPAHIGLRACSSARVRRRARARAR